MKQESMDFVALGTQAAISDYEQGKPLYSSDSWNALNISGLGAIQWVTDAYDVYCAAYKAQIALFALAAQNKANNFVDYSELGQKAAISDRLARYEIDQLIATLHDVFNATVKHPSDYADHDTYQAYIDTRSKHETIVAMVAGNKAAFNADSAWLKLVNSLDEFDLAEPDQNYDRRSFIEGYSDQLKLYAQADKDAQEQHGYGISSQEIRYSGLYLVNFMVSYDEQPLDKANYQTIVKRLTAIDDTNGTDSFLLFGFYSIALKVFTDETKTIVSPVYLEWLEIQKELADYPVLDEELMSNIESEEEDRMIKDEVRCYLNRLDIVKPLTDDPCEPVITASDVSTAIWQHNIDFGYSCYGENFIKGADLQKAIIYACLAKHDYPTLNAIREKIQGKRYMAAK